MADARVVRPGGEAGEVGDVGDVQGGHEEGTDRLGILQRRLEERQGDGGGGVDVDPDVGEPQRREPLDLLGGEAMPVMVELDADPRQRELVWR